MDDDISINWLATYVNQIAEAVGWNDPEVQSTFDGKMMLVVTETAEATEHWRDGKEPQDFHYVLKTRGDIRYSAYLQGLIDKFRENGQQSFTESERMLALGAGILRPRSIPDELADIIIRVVHIKEQLGIDLTRALKEKLTYNATREWRHGGKRV